MGLRMMREELQLSQEALAHAAGITKNQVQLLKAGRSSGRKDASRPSNPRMSTLAGLAAVFDLDVAGFLSRADQIGKVMENVQDQEAWRMEPFKDDVEDNSWMVEDGHIPADDTPEH